jgi:hypothetical protein
MKTRAMLLLICTSASVLGACGGESSRNSAEGGSDSTESLQDYFGGSDPAAQQAAFERQQQVIEQKIAKCMRAEGFEYSPSPSRLPVQSFDLPKRGEEVAYKRKRGYGVADSMNQSTSMQSQADDNPNNKRVAKMSEAERNAYQQALDGFDRAQAAGNIQSSEPKGCQGAAYKDLAEAYKPLESKFSQLQKRIETDTKIVALNAKFFSCMKKAGHPINKEQDIYEKLLFPKQQKIYESLSSAQPLTTDSRATNAEASPSPTIAPAKLKELKDYELQVANADADCRPQKDVDAVFEATKSYEAAFIQENKVLLEQLKAAQG